MNYAHILLHYKSVSSLIVMAAYNSSQFVALIKLHHYLDSAIFPVVWY